MAFVELLLSGFPEEARRALTEVVEANGLRFAWKGPSDAVAERGSWLGNLFGGAFAQRFAFPVTLRPHPEGVLLRIDMGDRGWMGGPLGAARVSDRHKQVTDWVAATLREQGLVVRRHDG